MKQSRKLALVTGARTGLGKFLSQHLIAQGFSVIGASRNPADWNKVGYIDFPTDITSENAVSALMRHIRGLEGSLEVLVNNAAVASMNAALLTPFSSIKEMMETNVSGAFLMSREAAKAMRKNGYGRIINISSVAVPLRLEGQAAYVASKSAVESLTQVLAKEFNHMGITVNALSLPPIDIGMTKGVPQAKLEKLVQSLPIKRMGTMKEVALALDKLIDKNSETITGKILSLSGFPDR